MPRTSNKAEKIVEFVNAFVAENGYSPSVREIGEAVGLRSTASVSYHLQALQEKGYNPINQIVGYILSEDPTYITNHNNARALIRKVDRDELLQTLVKYYLTH